MNKTKDRVSEELIAVDIEKLSAMLSCGHDTARKIGREAQAEIRLNRRVLYLVEKVRAYLDSISM